MKVKVGDQVKILAGKDRNKEGKIIKTLKNENKVVVEGINIIKSMLNQDILMNLVLSLLWKHLFMFLMLKK